MATTNRATAGGQQEQNKQGTNGDDFSQFEGATVVEDAGVLATLSRAEIDTQIRTAKAYPRSIQKFQREALTLATLDEETAASCFYRVPRDGKYIEGGSIRLAEICGSAWGNCHVGARIVDIDNRFVTAQAVAWDLEKNFRVTMEIRRGIVNRYGRVYSEDMIRTTAQAAMSVAVRNAIFRIVSPALVKKVLEEAKKVSLGKGISMEQQRRNAMQAMARFGATEADILRVLGKRGIEDLGVDEMITLKGMFTALKDGETTWESILEDSRKSQPRSEEDVRKTFETEFDHVDIPEDKKKQNGGADAADTGSEGRATSRAGDPGRPTPTAPPVGGGGRGNQPGAGTVQTPVQPAPADGRTPIPDDVRRALLLECDEKGIDSDEIFARLAQRFGDNRSTLRVLSKDELPAVREALGLDA